MSSYGFFDRLAFAWRMFSLESVSQVTCAHIRACAQVLSESNDTLVRVGEEAMAHHEDWHNALERGDEEAAHRSAARFNRSAQQMRVVANDLNESEAANAAWGLYEEVKRGVDALEPVQAAVECMMLNTARNL